MLGHAATQQSSPGQAEMCSGDAARSLVVAMGRYASGVRERWPAKRVELLVEKKDLKLVLYWLSCATCDWFAV